MTLLNKGLVSILIPVFNREHLVLETVKSIQSQHYENWECIIVDDGSTDHILTVLSKVAQEDSRIKVFQRPQKNIKGAASCRNLAYNYSSGEFIQYFDSDDIMFPSMLLDKVETLNKHPKLDFLVSKMGMFDENGAKEFVDYPLTSSNVKEDFLKYKLYFLTPGPLFRRSFLDAFEVKFDEFLERRQEREFYTRIILTDPNYVGLDEVHCTRRIHLSSIKSIHDSLTPMQQVKGKFEFFKRLSLNTDFKHSNLINRYHGKEVLRMGFFFLKEWQVLKSLEVFKFYLNLVWSSRIG